MPYKRPYKRVVSRSAKMTVKDITDLTVVENDLSLGYNSSISYTWKGGDLEWFASRRNVMDDNGIEIAEIYHFDTSRNGGFVPDHRKYIAQKHLQSGQWYVSTPAGYHVTTTPEEALDAMNADHAIGPKGRTVTVTIANVKLDHGVDPAEFAADVARCIGNAWNTLNGQSFGAKNVTITDQPAKAGGK